MRNTTTNPTPKTPSAWAIVHAHLGLSGAERTILSAEQAWELYCLADGFGQQSPGELNQINGGWDWSHIRDSSDAAIDAIANRILRIRGMA